MSKWCADVSIVCAAFPTPASMSIYLHPHNQKALASTYFSRGTQISAYTGNVQLLVYRLLIRQFVPFCVLRIRTSQLRKGGIIHCWLMTELKRRRLWIENYLVKGSQTVESHDQRRTWTLKMEAMKVIQVRQRNQRQNTQKQSGWNVVLR